MTTYSINGRLVDVDETRERLLEDALREVLGGYDSAPSCLLKYREVQITHEQAEEMRHLIQKGKA